jgi:hypothetical protein
MKTYNKFSDARLDQMCCYCGELPDTRDHVPSKVLLNDPFPENLPVVPCCNTCNQDFSKDEEYFACLIECIISGSAEILDLKREKIKRILLKRPALQRKLANARVISDDGNYFITEGKRIENVLLKLAKGHAQFDASSPLLGQPTHLAYKPIHIMTMEEKESFFSGPEIEKYPEVGSRLFFQIVESQGISSQSLWQIVQDDVYAYLISSQMGRLSVRLIISDFLAAEITWDENDPDYDTISNQ